MPDASMQKDGAAVDAVQIRLAVHFAETGLIFARVMDLPSALTWPVTVTDLAPAARPGMTSPAAASFAAAVGGAPRAKLGWTDVARFAALGIPAVNYGPGLPELAHTAGEYVETGAIADCEARLRAWLEA